MYILFSPSEGKNFGGNGEKISLFGGVDAREEILKAYNDIVLSSDEEAIKKLFGFKKIEECKAYIADLFTSPTLKTIDRYNGVAYEYLKYRSLNETAQKYVDEHTIIFSNLFGPLRASDRIPIYKVKQGNAVGTIKPEEFYKERLLALKDKRINKEGVLVIKAQKHRTQEKNRADALERMQALVKSVSVVKKTRRATRPTKGSKIRRLDKKTQRGKTKALRGKVSDE